MTVRIIELRGSSFMRITAKGVTIRPRGNLVKIVGRNEQGKSSVLNGIWAVLGGAKACPEMPIHAGDREARFSLDLDEAIAERVWTRQPDGSVKETITVTQRDGKPLKPPQAFLNGLIDKLTIDPLLFMAMDRAKQTETLRRIVGLDFTDIDKKADAIKEERAQLEQSKRLLEGQLSALGPFPDGLPEKEVSVGELGRRLTAVYTEVSDNNAKRWDAQEKQNAVHALESEYEKARLKVEDLEKKLADARAKQVEVGVKRTAAQMASRAATTLAESLVDPDPKPIEAEMEQVEAVNRLVRQQADAAALKTSIEGLAVSQTQQAAALKALKAERMERLSKAVFPMPDLSIDPEADVITLKGVPLDQASQAEQIRFSLTIGKAQNSRLRATRISQGSLIDDDGVKAIEQWAEANDFLVFMECVGDKDSPTGVIIEDGTVLADRQPGPAAPTPPPKKTTKQAKLEKVADDLGSLFGDPTQE